jgi:cyclohexyl-isocyanide hydratase
MRIAFILYDGVTLLDFAGAYDPLSRLKTMGFLPELAYDACAFTQSVRTHEGLALQPDKIKNDLSAYDYLFIPGGDGIGRLLADADFLSWIKNTRQEAYITAVCGGSLLLGAAGYLKDRKAATHPALRQYLAKFAQVSDARIVEDGRVITGGGVTAAIDVGLYIAEKIAGKEIRQKIQKQMDYTAYPNIQ